MRLSIVLVPVACALTAGACGGGNSAPAPVSNPKATAPPIAKPGPTFLYVHDSDHAILTYAIDEDTGALALRASTRNGGTNGGWLVAEPAGRLLFDFVDVTTCCHSPVDTDLRTFDLATDGTPSFSDAGRLPLHNSPLSLAASSRFLYLASRDIRDVLMVHALPVRPGIGGGIFDSGGAADWIAVSAAERILYAAGATPGEQISFVRSFALGPDGLGTELRSLRIESAYRALTRSMALDPSGRFVYLAVEEIEGPQRSVGAQIRIVATNDSGGLELAGSVSAPVGQLVVHPTGRFLYHTRGSAIDVYGVDDRRNPSLTLLYRINGDDQPLPLGAGYSLNGAPVADPGGRFLFGSGRAGIWGYAIDASTGALRYLGTLAPGSFDRPLIVTRPVADGGD